MKIIKIADKFDMYREKFGKDKINDFLANFGLGPKYIPKEPKKHQCPKCKKNNATYVENHPDTDMNEIVLKCPDCKFEGE